MDGALLRLARGAPAGRAQSYLCAMAKSVGLADRPAEDAEGLLRRSLVLPNEVRADLVRVEESTLLRSWLRKDHIDRRYRGTALYRSAATRLRESEDRGAPSLKEVKTLFALHGWSFGLPFEAADREDARRQALERAVRGSPDTRRLSYEDALELAGCAVHGRGEFNAYCENHGIYDFWTADYARALVDVLLAAKDRHGIAAPLRVVEVGAGDGKLSHLLRRDLAERNRDADVAVVATDSGRWRIPRTYPVEERQHADAIGDADVAISAWMPMGDDWTAAWRHSPRLREYILIGEAETGCCGHNWKTFGNAAFRDGDDDDGDPTPLHERDGFEKVEHAGLSRLQISRYDCASFVGNSRTFAFRRKP